jgi:hypothetical protein
MELKIFEDYALAKRHMVKSILFPSSRIVFEEKLWTPLMVEGTGSDGQAVRLDVPLMGEAAGILSKCVSVRQAKRHRDAFDIYYILSGVTGTAAAAQLLQLGAIFPQVATQLGQLAAYLETDAEAFNANVARFTGQYRPPLAPSLFVCDSLFSTPA